MEGHDRFDIAGFTQVDAPLASEPNIEAGTLPPQHDMGPAIEAVIGVNLLDDDSDDGSIDPSDPLRPVQDVPRFTRETPSFPTLIEPGFDRTQQIGDLPAELLQGRVEGSDRRDVFESDSGMPDLLKGEGLGTLGGEPSLRTPTGAAGLPPPPVTTEAMENEADFTDGDGVVEGHAYPVAGTYEQDGEEYVVLRNPYGEPNGDVDDMAEESPAPMTLEEAIATEVGATCRRGTTFIVCGSLPATNRRWSKATAWSVSRLR